MKKVFKLISLIYNLYKLKKIKFSYNNIKNFEILLIDDNTLEYLKETVLSNLNYTTIATRPLILKGKYYITFKIVFYFFWCLLFKKLNFKTSYIFSIIKVTKPKKILENTFDHNLIFLAKEFPKIKFFVLLQGTWFFISKKGKKFVHTAFHYELAKCKTGNLDNFNIFLWGKKDQEIFEEVGINKKNKNVNFIKIGSYEASFYKEKYINEIELVPKTIIFISQLHPIFFNSNNKFHKLILRDSITAINLILNFAKSNNYEFRYISRGKYEKNASEISFLKSKIKNFSHITVVENKECTLWKEIFAAELVTSLYSTGAHDSICLKKKTILIPLRHKDIYKWSSSKYLNDKQFWPWTIEMNNQAFFDEKCKNLLNLSQNEYEKKINNIHRYWFSNDYEKSNKKIINILKN